MLHDAVRCGNCWESAVGAMQASENLEARTDLCYATDPISVHHSNASYVYTLIC